MAKVELEYKGSFGEDDWILRFLGRDRVFTAIKTTAKIWKVPQFELLHEVDLPYKNASSWQVSPDVN